jgi:hypothetical protein
MNGLMATDVMSLSTVEAVQYHLHTGALIQLTNLLYSHKNKDNKDAYKSARKIISEAEKTILTHNAVNQLNVIAAKAGWMDVVILLRHTKATVDTIAELNSEK